MMRNCNRCIWSTRSGGCASFGCDFIDQEEAAEAYKVDKAAQIMASEQKGRWIRGKEVSRTYIGDVCVGITYDGWHCPFCDYAIEQSGVPMFIFCPACGAKLK